MPEANTLIIGILAIMAQQERELIADRTKKALAEKKKQGFTLGTLANIRSRLNAKEPCIVISMLRRISIIEGRGLSPGSCGTLATAGLRLQSSLVNDHGFTIRNGGSYQIVPVQRVVKHMG